MDTKLLCDDKCHELGQFFFEPTVLADVPPNPLFCHGETFGPVAVLKPLDKEVEVEVWQIIGILTWLSISIVKTRTEFIGLHERFSLALSRLIEPK